MHHGVPPVLPAPAPLLMPDPAAGASRPPSRKLPVRGEKGKCRLVIGSMHDVHQGMSGNLLGREVTAADVA
jgi:hypothetical protein